eukprot:7496224-Pyramimonas_sp.AAC.1
MADAQYIGGGIAMSNKRLDENFPTSPAPGTVLIPPTVSDGRFLTRQQDGSYDCDDCTNVGLQGAAGTWEDDDTRELLAQNRAKAYIQCRNCRWLCE